MKPLIGMCVLGRPQTTEKCIKALLSHTDRSKFQWAILDQDAIPQVKDVIERYKKEFDYVGQNDFNTGIVFGHNFLISLRKPSQTYIKWDDDCLVESDNWLELILKALSYSDIGSALCIRPTFWFDAPGRKEFWYREIKIEERDKDFWIQISPQDAGVVGCTWALKGEVLNQLGYFNEDLNCDDLDMPIRINQLGLKNVYLPDCVIKQPQEDNGHPRKWIAKALYNKNVMKSYAYSLLYHKGLQLCLESRFDGWFKADPGYRTGSDENWNFCKQIELGNIIGTYDV
jgi:GT2 family glycosyltransferase